MKSGSIHLSKYCCWQSPRNCCQRPSVFISKGKLQITVQSLPVHFSCSDNKLYFFFFLLNSWSSVLEGSCVLLKLMYTVMIK